MTVRPLENFTETRETHFRSAGKTKWDGRYVFNGMKIDAGCSLHVHERYIFVQDPTAVGGEISSVKACLKD